jgi:hypothetical protein
MRKMGLEAIYPKPNLSLPGDNDRRSPYLLRDVAIMETEEWVRTCKTVEELQNPKTLEKLELDRRYWQARGMNWGIVTDREIPGVLVGNMMQIHDLHFFRARSLRIAEASG